MHKELKSLLEQRCEKFFDRLEQSIVEQSIPLNAEFSKSKEPIVYQDRLKGEFNKIKEGESWGKEWEKAWFHLTQTVPENWSGKQVGIELNFDCECLFYSEDGKPNYFLTNACAFDITYRKKFYRLIEEAKGNENIDLWMHASNTTLDRDEDPEPDDPNKHGGWDAKTSIMKLIIFDENVWQLFLDFQILIGLMKGLPEKTPRRTKILRSLNEAIDIYQDNRKNALKSREVLKSVLSSPANSSSLQATSIGHAHIDTAWLWPVRETIGKTLRTFINQMVLLDKYPEYIFGASQPQHYQFLKDYYPDVYERLKQYVKDGRWELQGGMWVECDHNLTGGESMVRHFLYGKNFFMDEFGVDVKTHWLPDVFGYSAAVPQIMQKSGIDYFFTIKISWNQFNTFPFHSFVWQGIDGTEVLSHFSPTGNYSCAIHADELINAEKNFNENDICDEFLSPFGLGDGGGGPKDEFVERALRMQNLEGCPKVKFDHTKNFFDRTNKKREQLNKWVGELYFEYHRGTLTTQAQIKKENRKLEGLLKTIEFLYSALDLKDYPQDKLEYIWKKVMINQFHDIIPGSSIKLVNDDTHKDHQECLQKCSVLIDAFAKNGLVDEEGSIVLFNPLSVDFTMPIELPESFVGYEITDENNNIISGQDVGSVKVISARVPAQSFIKLKKGRKIEEMCKMSNTLVIENDLIKYEFSENGEILSAYDKETNREAVNKGNILNLYIDRPLKNDAWDVDIYYENELFDTAKSVSKPELIEAGKIRSGIKFNLKIGNSIITQKVYLSHNSKRLDFETVIDWQEIHKMLRVGFDTKIHSEQATYDIQYGYVKRNTHRNTSWDMAKFEVCGHKYVDLSNGDYGVALLNDCKYGHKTVENVMDLNLLRSPMSPDPEADRNQIHKLTYSLLPHTGNLINSDVIEESTMLNLKPTVFINKTYDTVKLPCQLTSQDGVSLEVIKKAEKEDCYIIRLVETKGKTSTDTLKFNSPVELSETNLIEWEETPWTTVNEQLVITLAPFELKTYKMKYK